MRELEILHCSIKKEEDHQMVEAFPMEVSDPSIVEVSPQMEQGLLIRIKNHRMELVDLQMGTDLLIQKLDPQMVESLQR